MARPLRLERAGAWYHLTARGNERRAIFRDERDRRHFCQLLQETVEMFRWRLQAYVLMDNHFHLLAETPEPNLARGMQWLNVSYSVWFNRRHQRAGHLFQGRYKAIVVEPESWGLELSRYLHLNPVRVSRLGLDKSNRNADRPGLGARPDGAMIRDRLAVLRDFRWSSYRVYIGLARRPEWLCLDLLRRTPARNAGKDAPETYRRYVESSVRQGLPESPWERLTAQTFLGTGRFIQEMKRALRGDAREQTAARRLRPKTSIEEVIAAIERVRGRRWAAFRDLHGDWGRDVVLYLARRRCGLGLKELGHAAGAMDYASVSVTIHRFARRLSGEPALRRHLEACEKELQATDIGLK
jgi:REP element-mobilizing transposase RayT